jgi:hypothetical protein
VKRLSILIPVIFLSILFSNFSYANYTCGIKPIPNIGCTIGQCVNGNWQQVCSKTDFSGNQQATSLRCGIKPIPKIGCTVGQCINGNWQQVCS